MSARISRSAFLALASVGTAGLAACSSGATGNPFVQTGTVRFINGSPDAGPVDFKVASTTIGTGVQNPTQAPKTPPAGQYAATNTGYHNINAGQQGMAVYPTGSSTALALTSSSATALTVIVNSRITVVLTGTKTAGYELVPFTETLYTTNAGNASVQFHHAAQSLATSTISVGAFPANTPGSLIPFSSSIQYKGAPYETPLPQPLVGTAVGFYAQGGALTTAVTILPSQVDTQDVSNLLPFVSGDISDVNLSMYLIDSPGGVVLVGVFDPNQ